MNELILVVPGVLFLLLLARVRQTRCQSRARWPGPGSRVTRGPLSYGSYGSSPWGHAWGRPWR